MIICQEYYYMNKMSPQISRPIQYHFKINPIQKFVFSICHIKIYIKYPNLQLKC